MSPTPPARRDPNLPDELINGAVSAIPIPGLSLVGPLAGRLARAVRAEWARNLSVALYAAEETAGLSREQLTELLAENPRLVLLFVRVIHAAGMNGHDEALKGMGAALGDAARAPSRANEAEVILAAFVDLTADHIALLRCVSVPDPRGQDGAALWSTEHVLEAVGLPETTVTVCFPLSLRGGWLKTRTAALEEVRFTR